MSIKPVISKTKKIYWPEQYIICDSDKQALPFGGLEIMYTTNKSDFQVIKGTNKGTNRNHLICCEK